jgi:hypothetical protein
MVYQVLYWTDSRLAGVTPGSRELPKKLWGPRLSVSNLGDSGDLAESQWAFELTDAGGRMKVRAHRRQQISAIVIKHE